MATLQRAAAYYTNIWCDESPLFYGHNVDAPQSVSPINYYVITVPSQHSSSYADSFARQNSGAVYCHKSPSSAAALFANSPSSSHNYIFVII